MKRLTLILMMALIALVLIACGQKDDKKEADKNIETPTTPNSNEQTEPQQIDATFKDADDKTIGSAVISEEEGKEGLIVQVDVENLPAGKHGFHIHEKGKCEAPDFKSAGGHFNPGHQEHGMDNPEGPHAGDMDNLDVPESGEVKEEVLAKQVSLDKDSDNYLFGDGAVSLMIHAEADDNKTDPAGNAGDRIACAEVNMKEAK